MISSADLIQSLLNGLTLSSIYILVSLGMALIMSIMNIVQMAHGEVYMVGAYIVYYFFSVLGLNYYVALVLSVILVGGLGIILQRFLFRRYQGVPERAMIVSVGLMLVLQNIVIFAAGGQAKGYDSPFAGIVEIFGAGLSEERLVIIFVGLILVIGLFIFVRYTKQGQAMLAISQEKEGAALQGININYIGGLAFFMGCALAAIAGGLVGGLFSLLPTMGSFSLMKGIAIIVLGGMGSIPGVIVGSLILGFVDGVVPMFSTPYVAGLIGYGAIVLILFFRPRGLWGHES
jgi:branched-chain amino acid transport system permease protein